MELLKDLALSRFAVDRAAPLRADADWLNRAWAQESTRVLVLKDNALPVTDELSLIWVKPEATHLTLEQVAPHAVLLGVDNGHTYVGIMDDIVTIDAVAWVALRAVGAQLSAHDVGLATTAIAMSQWHATHKFCTRCGSATMVTQGGWARQCSTDGSDHYPRTEPAMIVAVNDKDDRILLGRRIDWPEGWFSTLAGFVEAGESAEACVIREVFEESGIRLDLESLQYLGSQPWPYPASLMLGYRATATSIDISVEVAEMAQVKWFSREEFVAECKAETLRLPNPVAIAFRLIQDWYGSEIPQEWTRK
ncbi:MAG: NAD(+) diphosphatase [Actinomycetes bacterium]